MRSLSCFRLALLLLLMVGVPASAAAQTAATETGSGARLPELELPPLPPLSDFDAILERPLFSPGRTADADEGVSFTSATAEELRAEWQLTGILLVGQEFKALLRRRSGDQHRMLATGMPLDDTWVLTEIRSQSILLQASDVEVQLQLREPRDTQPTGAPANRTDNGQGTGNATSSSDAQAPQGGSQ